MNSKPNKDPVMEKAKALSDQFHTPIGDQLLFLVATIGIIVGWSIRDQKLIIAEEGLGYFLGIIGGSMMLLLLLYPVRKKSKRMRNLGKIRHWFRMHMAFGILGPLLVIYHSNFHLGSMNSNVALYCMLLVAGSGLVGRYFYTKIHYGLYGRVATLKQLTDDDNEIRKKLNLLLRDVPQAVDKIKKLEEFLIQPSGNVFLRLVNFLFARPRVFFSRLSIKNKIHRHFKKKAKKHGWRPELRKRIENEINLILDDHFFLMERIAHFRFFERMFALWHLFHYPFFLMMVVSALVHVVVVHVY